MLVRVRMWMCCNPIFWPRYLKNGNVVLGVWLARNVYTFGVLDEQANISRGQQSNPYKKVCTYIIVQPCNTQQVFDRHQRSTEVKMWKPDTHYIWTRGMLLWREYVAFPISEILRVPIIFGGDQRSTKVIKYKWLMPYISTWNLHWHGWIALMICNKSVSCQNQCLQLQLRNSAFLILFRNHREGIVTIVHFMKILI